LLNIWGKHAVKLAGKDYFCV